MVDQSTEKYGWFFCAERYGTKSISVMATTTAYTLASKPEYIYVAAVCLTKDGQPLVAPIKAPFSYAAESVLESEAEQEAKRVIPGSTMPEQIAAAIMKKQARLANNLNTDRNDANALFSPPATVAEDGTIEFKWDRQDLEELARIAVGD